MKQIKNEYYRNCGKFEEIIAEKGSTVDVENAVVYARNGSTVKACDGSKVRAYKGSRIINDVSRWLIYSHRLDKVD